MSPSDAPHPEPPGTDEYEFSARDERVIGDLGRNLRFVGAATMALAVVLVVLGTHRMTSVRDWDVVSTLLLALAVFLVGSWMRASGREFGKVAETYGRDVTHLMNAIGSLGRVFRNVGAVIAFLIVLAAIQLVLAIWYRARGG
jgi:hypothetical protein